MVYVLSLGDPGMASRRCGVKLVVLEGGAGWAIMMRLWDDKKCG